MDQTKNRPGVASGADGSDGATTASKARVADPPPDLVRRADRALRAALKEGVTGPEVEQLMSWVTRQRVALRRRKVRAELEAVVGEVRAVDRG